MTDTAQPHISSGPAHLLLAADLAGTLVFAIEGAMAAVDARLDVIGIMVLAFTTALGGGIIRDTLLGAAPPASLKDWRYPAIALTGAGFVFFLYHYVHAIPLIVIQIFDAAGLSLFAVAGTQKAMLHRMSPLVVVLLGTITGVGGGTLRDVLLNQVPTVLRAEVYATAALLGSLSMVALIKLRVPAVLAGAAGAVACFLLRVVSVWNHWNLPRALGN